MKKDFSIRLVAQSGFVTNESDNLVRVKELELNNEVRFAPLRISGTATRSINGEANIAQIAINNLSLSSRNFFDFDLYADAEAYQSGEELKRTIVELWAGYNGLQYRIFRGELVKGQSKKLNPGWVTEIKLRDGESIISKFVSMPLPQGTSGQELFSKIGPTGRIDPIILSANRSRALFGPGLKTAADLAEGYHVFVMDGAINCIKKGTPLGSQVLKISGESGLLSTPYIDGYFVKLETIFEPLAVPSNFVQVVSEGFRFSGQTLQINQASHHVDNYGKNTTQLDLWIVPYAP